MKKSFCPVLAGALLVLFWGGCASYVAAERARISLVDVRPAGATVLETSVQLTVRVTNETNQPLRLSGSSHKLALNGTSIGNGVTNEGLVVPALGTATQTITVHLENLTLLRKFSGMRNATEVNYRLDSRLHSEGGRAVPVMTEGTFDLRPFLAGLQ